MNLDKKIILSANNPFQRRVEWRPWKKKGYRVLDTDGKTVWHELEAIRQRVLNTFADIDADVFLFGSQVSGRVNTGSDYDVGYYTDNTVSISLIVKLKDELEELPIPSVVDLVDFSQVSCEFKTLVLKKEVEIWKRKHRNSLFT